MDRVISLSTVVRNTSKNPPFRLDPDESGRGERRWRMSPEGSTFGSPHIGLI